MKRIAFLLLAIALCGCENRDDRRNVAQVAANGYAAAEAAMSGADATKCLIAIRLAFEKVAEMHGFTIDGAQTWQKSITEGGSK